MPSDYDAAYKLGQQDAEVLVGWLQREHPLVFAALAGFFVGYGLATIFRLIVPAK